MSRRSRTAAASLLALGLALAAAAPASAGFGPIRLVSAIPPEQATVAVAPALSADGRYLAFQGTIDEGREGVFRLELASGDLARVATGGPNEQVPAPSEASAPSISADGRYVSFTTRAQLDPVGDPAPGTKDVYVADMSGGLPSYELASALDESSLALGGDSVAAPRVALSADGRRVAFVNDRQVYLRDLDTLETTLVSVRRDPEGGAMEPGVPVPEGAVFAKFEGMAGASLSADGTTVAWVGAHLPEQVPLLADEKATIESLDTGIDPNDDYNEPLWRRVADGTQAPTRRIAGGGDPLAPGCPGTAGTLAEPACRGPFPAIAGSTPVDAASGWLSRDNINGIPQLSADGRTVAVIGNPSEAANVFLVDMAPGLSRVQAIRQLTAQVPVKPGLEHEVVNEDAYIPLNGHIFDLATSMNAGRIAFATARQRFPLAPPNLVSAPPAQLGLVELYLIDLETESLRRLTHGVGSEAEPSLGVLESGNQVTVKGGSGASAPSFGGGGRLIGFSSGASNLVPGDGNEASDVFLLEDESAPTQAGATSISAPPRQRRPGRPRGLALSAFSMPSGAVRLVVVAPAAGSLQASAAAALGAASRARRLDRERAPAREDRPVSMVLALPGRLRHLARSPEGLYATARVAFRSAKGRRLYGRLQVRFHAHPRRKGGRG